MKTSVISGRLLLLALTLFNLLAVAGCATGDYDRNPASLSECNDEVTNAAGECRQGLGPRSYVDHGAASGRGSR